MVCARSQNTRSCQVQAQRPASRPQPTLYLASVSTHPCPCYRSCMHSPWRCMGYPPSVDEVRPWTWSDSPLIDRCLPNRGYRYWVSTFNSSRSRWTSTSWSRRCWNNKELIQPLQARSCGSRAGPSECSILYSVCRPKLVLEGPLTGMRCRALLLAPVGLMGKCHRELQRGAQLRFGRG